MKFPRAEQRKDRRDGWVIDPAYLVSVKKAAQRVFGVDFYSDSLDMEQIEQVLLAVEECPLPSEGA